MFWNKLQTPRILLHRDRYPGSEIHGSATGDWVLYKHLLSGERERERERERDAKHTFKESGHYFELPLHHISVLIKNWISRKIIDSCHFQEILGLRIYYKYTGILRKIIAFCYQNELYLTTLQIIINKRKYICAIDIYTYMHRHVYYHIVDYLEVLILYSNMHYIFRLLKLP